MAEIRERLNDLDRPSPARDDRRPAAPEVDGPDTGARFDYLGFERRFRGNSQTILATQRERYQEVLRGHAPVLDLGCARGELVGALDEAGIVAAGVDRDEESVPEA